VIYENAQSAHLSHYACFALGRLSQQSWYRSYFCGFVDQQTYIDFSGQIDQTKYTHHAWNAVLSILKLNWIHLGWYAIEKVLYSIAVATPTRTLRRDPPQTLTYLASEPVRQASRSGKRAGQNARVTRLIPSSSYYITKSGYDAL
jgi:hypothetical protein